jgi:hypothetical protein
MIKELSGKAPKREVMTQPGSMRNQVHLVNINQ